jgi:hypothetical protein
MIEPISGVSKPSPQVQRLALAMSLQKRLAVGGLLIVKQLWALGHHKILIWRLTTLPKYSQRIQAFSRTDILALGC